MTTDADLLAELAMVSVEAVPVSDADHVAERVPKWCEIVLKVERENRTHVQHFTRHDCELIIEVVHGVLHPHTNKHSPVQRLWSELDDVMDYLMADDDPSDEDKASARSLALAIALISQPWSEEPDVAAVRQEAVERWEDRQ